MFCHDRESLWRVFVVNSISCNDKVLQVIYLKDSFFYIVMV